MHPESEPQPAIEEPRTLGGAVAMSVLSGSALMIASIADLVAYSTAGGIETPNHGSSVRSPRPP
ncbi:hypothetical protein AX769_17875 [Frondihabitans sp. PAMC 28766]|nr:hypothetical protein AX769_17875 [Frondihabitans sp. PAMC 28766]